MIIYLDLLILYDILVNIIILIVINISFNDKIKILRILISSIVSALMLVLVIYYKECLTLLKMFGGLIISLISFKGFFNVNKILKFESLLKTGSYYLFNFSFVGLLHVFEIRKWYLLILIFSILTFILLFISLKKYVIFIKTCEYSVIVKIANEYFRFKGFLDTGNKSVYNGMPIIYINEKYSSNVSNMESVCISTVSGDSYLMGVVPEVFVIENKNIKKAKKVFVCFACIEEDCLLNPLLFV